MLRSGCSACRRARWRARERPRRWHLIRHSAYTNTTVTFLTCFERHVFPVPFSFRFRIRKSTCHNDLKTPPWKSRKIRSIFHKPETVKSYRENWHFWRWEMSSHFGHRFRLSWPAAHNDVSVGHRAFAPGQQFSASTRTHFWERNAISYETLRSPG